MPRKKLPIYDLLHVFTHIESGEVAEYKVNKTQYKQLKNLTGQSYISQDGTLQFIGDITPFMNRISIVKGLKKIRITK